MTPALVRRRRWTNYAACVWALLFAAPHALLALGSPFAFPGGPANHQIMMNLRMLAWIACGVLGLRGVAGLAIETT